VADGVSACHTLNQLGAHHPCPRALSLPDSSVLRVRLQLRAERLTSSLASIRRDRPQTPSLAKHSSPHIAVPVPGHFENALADALRVARVVSECLGVSDGHENFVFGLHLDAVAQGAYIVAKVEFSRRAVAGQNGGFHVGLAVIWSSATTWTASFSRRCKEVCHPVIIGRDAVLLQTDTRVATANEV
jgi:hypothetical protein